MKTIALFMLFLLADPIFATSPAHVTSEVMRNFSPQLGKELITLNLKTALSGRFAVDPDIEQKLIAIQHNIDALIISGITSKRQDQQVTIRQYIAGKITRAQAAALLGSGETETEKLARLYEFTDNYYHKHGLASILTATITHPNLNAEQLLADYKQIMTKYGSIFTSATLQRAQATQQRAEEILAQAAESTYAEAAQQARIRRLLEGEVIKLQAEARDIKTDYQDELSDVLGIDPKLIREEQRLTNLRRSDQRLQIVLEKVYQLYSLLDEHIGNYITLAELAQRLDVETALAEKIVNINKIYRQYNKIAREQVVGELSPTDVKQKYAQLLDDVQPFLAEQKFQQLHDALQPPADTETTANHDRDLRGGTLSALQSNETPSSEDPQFDPTQRLLFAAQDGDKDAAQAALEEGGDLHKVMMFLFLTDEGGDRVSELKLLVDLDSDAAENILSQFLISYRTINEEKAELLISLGANINLALAGAAHVKDKKRANFLIELGANPVVLVFSIALRGEGMEEIANFIVDELTLTPEQREIIHGIMANWVSQAGTDNNHTGEQQTEHLAEMHTVLGTQDNHTSAMVASSDLPSAAEAVAAKLVKAVYRDDTDNITRLLRAEELPVDVVIDDIGTTLLHHAASEGKLKTTTYLIKELGANPNITNSLNFTPLDAALFFRHQKIAKFLVDNGAISADAQSESRIEGAPTL